MYVINHEIYKEIAMNNLKMFIVAMSVLGLFFASNVPAYAAPDLNANQVKALLIGHTTEGKKDGNKWTMQFKPDGTLYGTYGSLFPQNGVYEIKANGQYCRKWESWVKVYSPVFESKRRGRILIWWSKEVVLPNR